MTGPGDQRRGLLIGLSIAFSVLTLTTIGLGAATIALLSFSGSATAAPATPSPTPSFPPGYAATTIDGYEISAVTDLTVDAFALTVSAYDGDVSLNALMTNEDETRGAQVFFDITAYREDGSIIERGLDIVYAPPGETSIMRSSLPDLDEAVAITVEQTAIDWLAPDVTGGATVDTVTATGLGDLLEYTLTSTISVPTEYVDLFLVGSLDDEIVGVCTGFEDIPASGVSFEGHCDWENAAIADPIDVEDELPDDVEFRVYVRLDAPDE